MRILFLSDCPFIPNSLGKIAYYITRGLIERGHEVYNICPASTTTLFSTGFVYNPCESVYEPITGRYHLCSEEEMGERFVVYPWAGSLKHYTNYLDPDVILLFGTPYAPPLHEALRECYSLDKPCAGYFDNESLVVIPEYALHAANATAYASPTEFARKTIADGLIASGISEEVVEERSMVVYHGVDIDMYARAEVEPLWSDKQFTYGTFSKNHIRKNIGVLIKAYSSLPRDVIEKTRLFIALIGFGGGNEWKTELLVKYVEQEMNVKISDRVIGIDKFEYDKGVTEYQVLRIYTSMDVFVFPSEGESFGLPPIEAALMGKPVIVTSHPALLEIWHELPREVIVKSRPYILPDAFGLVKPDPEEMANAMYMLFIDERFRKRVAQKAREIALRYDWRKMVDGIEKLVRTVAEIGAEPISKVSRRR